MRDYIRASVYNATRNVLIHVARFCMRHGLKHADVDDILRWAFVQVAAKDLGAETGRASNTSLAEATGLSRRQVASLRAATFPERFNDESSVPSGIALMKWYNDPDYLTEDGAARRLYIGPVTGEKSFSDLVRSVDAKISPRDMLDELVKSNSVRITDDGMVEVTSRTFIMSGDDESAIRYFGAASSNLMATLNWNTDPSRTLPVMFERTAWSSGMPPAAFLRFSNIVKETSKPFLELVDDWLASHQLPDEGDDDSSVVGVGVYVFQRTPGDE